MVENKKCIMCNVIKNVDQFYKNKRNKDGLHSYCKECTIKKSNKYQKDNPERTKSYTKEIYKRKPQYFKEKYKRWTLHNKEKYQELTREWRRNNKDKVKEYRENRLMHKNHDISDEELNIIYVYANHSCMYCGMSEKESIEKYGQKLHKDHADNNGSDGVNNCILACKSCNSSKHDKDWEDWYKNSEVYDNNRYNLILSWLEIWK